MTIFIMIMCYDFLDGLHPCYKPWDDHDDHDNHNDDMNLTLHLGYEPGDYHDDNDV